MQIKPQVPAVLGTDDGVMVAYTKNRANAIVDMVIEQEGGAEGLREWKNRNEKNETIFWKDIFTKRMVREHVVDDQRKSVEDLLAIIDGDFTDVTPRENIPMEVDGDESDEGYYD